jgi:hypothetical protein
MISFSVLKKTIGGATIFTSLCLFLYSMGKAFSFRLLLETYFGIIIDPMVSHYIFVIFGTLVIIFALLTVSIFNRDIKLRNDKINGMIQSKDAITNDHSSNGNRVEIPNQLRTIYILTIIVFATTIVLLLVRIYIIGEYTIPVLEYFWGGLFYYSYTLSMLLIAVLVLRLAKNAVAVDYRINIRGYHIHECLFGIYFLFIGVPLFLTAGNMFTLESFIGGFFTSFGLSLIGRDWEDVIQGHFIEK